MALGRLRPAANPEPLPDQPEKYVFESAEAGDADCQRDDQGHLRPDAVKNASEACHNTDPYFSFLRISIVAAREFDFDGHHILSMGSGLDPGHRLEARTAGLRARCT